MPTPASIWARPDGEGGSLITLWVVPGASRSQVRGAHGDALKVTVTAPPEAGRANRAVEELLSGLLGESVIVVGGHGSRRKTAHAPTTPPATVARVLVP
jgi:uncharacterized protein (TIGR00251 family)